MTAQQQLEHQNCPQLLSFSCGTHLISLLMMSSLVCRLFSQTLSFRYYSENSQAVWDLGNRMARGYWVDVTRGYWVDVKWVHPMVSYARVVFCSVWEMRRHLISRTEHFNISGITSHGTGSFCVKPITPVHPIPKISTHLTIFWGGTWKKEFVKTIYRQERTSSEKKSHEFHKKCSIELWTISIFELLLCCHTAARCMEWT